MKRSLTIAAFLIACTSYGCLQAQEKPKPPQGTLGVGWSYLWADQGNDYRSNLNGWYVRPAVNLGKGYSLFADFTNYYGKNSKGAVNSHGYTVGLSAAVFTKPKFKPSVFIEAGDVRASSAGTITHQLAINAGGNFTVPLAHWVALAVTPAEYIFLYPNSDWRNDYNAKIGFSFPLGRH